MYTQGQHFYFEHLAPELNNGVYKGARKEKSGCLGS
jgi:hypothetical protein